MLRATDASSYVGRFRQTRCPQRMWLDSNFQFPPVIVNIAVGPQHHDVFSCLARNFWLITADSEEPAGILTWGTRQLLRLLQVDA